MAKVEAKEEEIPKEAREFKTPEKIIEESKPIIKEILGKYQEGLEKNPEINSIAFEGEVWKIDTGSKVEKNFRKLYFNRLEQTSPGEEIFDGYGIIDGKGKDVYFSHSKTKKVEGKLISEEEEEIDSMRKRVENGNKALAELEKIQEAIRKGEFNFSSY